MNSIPTDLIHEIFSRLPVKSIGRCRCVSEQWRSILCGPDFTELFLTRSSARPRLLFVIKGFLSNEWLFYSSPQAHPEKSSLADDFQLKVRGDMWIDFCGRASGLFCFHQQKGEDRVHVICNPTTGQYELLPKLRMKSRNYTGFDPIDKVLKVLTSTSFLGFDPIDKIFKVVSMSSCASGHRILSLGTGIMSWRKIQFRLTHNPMSKGICINGVLYYLAQHINEYLIVCFYVRSEQFKFVHAGFINRYLHTELINYKDKLGVTSCKDGKLRMWVLEDVEKHDWSEYAYTLPKQDNFADAHHVSVVGVTATGEIVILEEYYVFASRWLYVFYFHPERNTVQRVEMQGFGNPGRVHAFVDHVDDLTFPMIPQQQQGHRRFESINKFNALSLLDDV